MIHLAEKLESSYNVTTGTNKGYESASALQIRLDTAQIIENIEMFLRGTIITVEQDDKGRITTKREDIGKPKANALGIQSILNWVQLILNPQVVQGNFSVDGANHSTMYENYIYYGRIDLTTTLVVNCYNWCIMDEDIDLIVDSIMNAIEPFMTRLIDNKERESYEATLRHIEHNTMKQGKEGFKLFDQNK